MVLQRLTENAPQWLLHRNPNDDLVLTTQCRLVRNLADFPFPNQCSPTELRNVEVRILEALDNLNLMDEGEYYSLENLSDLELRVLLERSLIRPEILQASGSRGVYISQDEGLSISINETEHLVITARGTGLQLQETFTRVNRCDDLLSGILDFAFDERRGFLTSSLTDVGTGLKASTTLHLPGLVSANEVGNTRNRIEEKHHQFEYAYDPTFNGAGDLYTIMNSTTLGRSEEEILFHIKHLAGDLAEQERHQRTLLQNEMSLQMEDRVYRAQGLARSARLLAMNEGLEVLSSLRLGHTQGLLQAYPLQHINEVLVASQSAHLELRHGREYDDLTINADRAEMFRTRFA